MRGRNLHAFLFVAPSLALAAASPAAAENPQHIHPSFVGTETHEDSRAIDLVAVDQHLWAADGGIAGHSSAPPGTVLNYDLGSAQEATIRIGPTLEGDDEEQTTVGAGGSHVWAGNKDSETVTQLEPPTRATIHGVARGGLAVVADATVWAAIPPATATLPRIDPATNRVVARIPLRTRAVDGLVVAHGLVWAAVPASQ